MNSLHTCTIHHPYERDTQSGAVNHEVDDGDGVCGDCLWCQENVESDCIVPSDPKCSWCGHCLGNHAESCNGRLIEVTA